MGASEEKPVDNNEKNTESNTVDKTQNDNQKDNTAGDNHKEMSIEDYKSALADARKEAARYRTERNDYKKDAEAYREQEKDKLSDVEKLNLEIKEAQERYNTVENEKSGLELELKKLQIGVKYGITEDNLSLLGNDIDSIEDNARRIKDLQDATDGKHIPRKTPAEKLHSGASQEEKKDLSYPSNWVVTGRFKK